MRYILIFLFLFLMSCTTNQIVDDGNVSAPLPVEYEGRPIFDRTPIPEPEPEPEGPIITPNQSVFIVANEQSAQFSFPIGWSFGEVYPIITQRELPLLRPAAIQTGDNRFRGYRQNIIFSNFTGNVTFVVDERDEDYVGTVLAFDADERFLAYELLLDGRPFMDPAVIGSDILLLGREYKIMEATNFTLLLNGLTIEQYLRVEDEERVETNNRRLDSDVHYDGYDFRYWLIAPDEQEDSLWLKQGETLREKIPDFFPGVFDVRYDGLESFVGNTLVFDVDDDDVTLRVNELELPLLGLSENGTVQFGSERKVHFTECASSTDECIFEEDIIVLQGLFEGTPVTTLLRVSGIDQDEQKIIFRDVETRERISTDYRSVNNRPFEAYLPFFDREYRIFVINTTEQLANGSNISRANSLAVDLDGDNRVAGEQVPLLFPDLEISIGELTNNRVNITFSSGYVTTEQRHDSYGFLNKEELRIEVVYDNGFSVLVPEHDALWDQRLQEYDTGYAYGLSPWGTEVVLEYTGSEQETTDSLTLLIPFEQRLAQLSMGSLR